MNPLKLYFHLIRYETLALIRERQAIFHPLFLYILVSFLFPLAVTSDPELLSIIAPGVLWIALLLANLLTIDALFQIDHRQGLLEQWVISSHSLNIVVLAKCTLHWLASTLPLLFLTPFLGFMLNLTLPEIGIVCLSMVLATPTLTLLMAVLNAILLNTRQGSFILAMVCVPLFIPLLILACGSAVLMQGGIFPSQSLLFLTSISLFSIAVLPMVIKQALILGIQS